MNFPNRNSDHPQIFSPPKQLQLNLQQAFSNLHNHCSNFLNSLPLLNPNPNSLTTHLQSSLSHIQNQAKFLFHDSSASSSSGPVWARISENRKVQPRAVHKPSNLTPEQVIEERLTGIPVYALSTDAEKFVFISGASSGKSLGLFCFSKEDAETCLAEMKSLDPVMKEEDYKVVPVALNKIVGLKVDDVAVRLLPESAQLKNAMDLLAAQEGEKPDAKFTGVPVFQSRSLVLQSQKQSYRPAFFRKEDLDLSLARAARQQNRLNPAVRADDIEIAIFEDIIKGMKVSSASEWNDIVFIPPGYDVSTTPPKP